MPSFWALLEIDSIGASVLEIVLDHTHEARTITTVRIMGIAEIPDFNILINGVHRPHSEEGRDNSFKSNLSAAAHRLQKNV